MAVYTNSEVKAKGEGEGWGIATNGVIEVPAEGKQGFFYLMSKPAVSDADVWLRENPDGQDDEEFYGPHIE